MKDITKNIRMKGIALALCAALGAGSLALPASAMAATPSSPAVMQLSSHRDSSHHDGNWNDEDWQRHHDNDGDHKNPPPKPKKETKKSTNSHSESEVWTAGVIGAVIGAVVAKNT